MSLLSEEEVRKMVKDIHKVMAGKRSYEDAAAILKKLRRHSMTQDLLQSTRIGLVLNDLRKTECGEKNSSMAKQLIKHWKKHVNSSATNVDSNEIPAISAASDGKQQNGHGDDEDSNLGHEDSNDGNSNDAPANATDSNSSIDVMRVRSSGDEMRDRCRKMLSDSFKKDDLPDGTLDPDYVAQEIEQALFDVHASSMSTRYSAAVRSRVFNLRDKKNRALRDNVLTGVIKASDFAVMKAEEMASEEVKQMRVKFTKEALNDYQMAQETGTATDMFKCGKCKKKDCTYRQAQTRSADEPMTTFVWCRNCGNRWKFC